MSKLAYLKVSAALVFVTIGLNLPAFIKFAAACSGDSGHCGI